MLRANPNPPQAALAPRALQATTNKDKESQHRSVREIVFQIVISRANPIGNAIGYAKLFSRSHDPVIRIYDEAGNVIETHEHTGDFKDPEQQPPSF